MSATELEVLLRRLVDKDEIRELVAKYSLYADFGRFAEMFELFAEDCVFDYGPTFGGRHYGRAAFIEYMRGPGAARLPRFRATTHHNANVLIDFIDENTATGWTGLYAWHEMEDGSHAEVWGYYEDMYVRTPEGWRFRQRVERTAGQQNFAIEWNPLRRP